MRHTIDIPKIKSAYFKKHGKHLTSWLLSEKVGCSISTIYNIQHSENHKVDILVKLSELSGLPINDILKQKS